jgi:hypothetical protein
MGAADPVCYRIDGATRSIGFPSLLCRICHRWHLFALDFGNVLACSGLTVACRVSNPCGCDRCAFDSSQVALRPRCSQFNFRVRTEPVIAPIGRATYWTLVSILGCTATISLVCGCVSNICTYRAIEKSGGVGHLRARRRAVRQENQFTWGRLDERVTAVHVSQPRIMASPRPRLILRQTSPLL